MPADVDGLPPAAGVFQDPGGTREPLCQRVRFSQPGKENVMSQPNIIRAWKDEEYRRSLSEAERASLPSHPAGLVELTAADLGQIDGGLAAAGGGCNCCKKILWTAYCSF